MAKKIRRSTDEQPPASTSGLIKLVPRWRKQVNEVGGGLAISEQVRSLSTAALIAWADSLLLVVEEMQRVIKDRANRSN